GFCRSRSATKPEEWKSISPHRWAINRAHLIIEVVRINLQVRVIQILRPNDMSGEAASGQDFSLDPNRSRSSHSNVYILTVRRNTNRLMCVGQWRSNMRCYSSSGGEIGWVQDGLNAKSEEAYSLGNYRPECFQRRTSSG